AGQAPVRETAGAEGQASGRSSRTTAGQAAGQRSRGASAGQAAGPGASAAAKPADGPRVVGACPRPGCGGTIFMGKKGYGCSHYKTGCTFVIWKESFGRSLTDAQVKALLEKGKTAKLKLERQGGEEVSARLVLADPSTGRLETEE
ncbi:topoisomerase C-terminal repeat-containing protein, partial [Paenibacillus chitinolyticus]